MLGAIIGDIVGSRWEFNPTNNYNFQLFSDKNSYTDDTICTIAVADALLHGSDNYGKFIHQWCRKYPNPMGGYGRRFRAWVMSDAPQPYGSFGNGSAMRVSPIGWWFCDMDQAMDEAEKSAECTHNHPEGIKGARAIVCAMNNVCEGLRRMDRPASFKGRMEGAIEMSRYNEALFLDIKKAANTFDETCQGTVPVALWIILHSTSFEDAIRQAVSLGADADTLGAIVGSIAECIWGIPEWIKEKALSYLPDDMKEVIVKFNDRINRIRQLSKKCTYFKYRKYFEEQEHQEAYEVEKKWVYDLAVNYHNADKAKKMLKDQNAIVDWKGDYADVYELPLSLIGYIVDHVAHGEISTAIVKERLEDFLDEHYEQKNPIEEPPTNTGMTEEEKKEQFKTIMFWRLGLGHIGKLLHGEDPMPDKSTPPTEEMIKDVQPMPDNEDDVCEYPLSIPLSQEELDILRKGHIPESQDDHWFMYTDDEYIRYFRSWTGMCAFEAHYLKDGDIYSIENVRINKNLCEFGVNGTTPGAALFRYLLVTEVGGDSDTAWNYYLHEWEITNAKYSK